MNSTFHKTKSLLLAAALLALPFAVRAQDDRFAHWEKDIAAFEQMDREHPPQPGDVLFIGASGLTLWKTLEEDFAEYRGVNRGFGGSQMIDSVHFADRIIGPHQPRFILVHAGGNDLHAGVSPEDVAERFKQFVAAVRAKHPDAIIAYRGIAPSIARWHEVEKIKQANSLIEAYCRTDPKLIFIEMFSKLIGPDGKPRAELFMPDGLHYNAQGHAIEKQIYEPYLKPDFKKPPLTPMSEPIPTPRADEPLNEPSPTPRNDGLFIK